MGSVIYMHNPRAGISSQEVEIILRTAHILRIRSRYAVSSEVLRQQSVRHYTQNELDTIQAKSASGWISRMI